MENCTNMQLTAIPEQGQSGTTLTADVTATGHFTRTFTWTIDKFVTPNTLNLFRGDTGVPQYTISVIKDNGTNSTFIDGTVCVTNGGAVSTENLNIIVKLTMPPSSSVIATVNVDISQHPVLAPGETFCYPYQVNIPSSFINAGGTYKVTADITITNHSGHLGTPFGPNPSATTTLPFSPTLINDTVHVIDTNDMSETFNTSGQLIYTKTFTCDQDAGVYTNTATIVETGQSATAELTVNCYDLVVTKDASTSFKRTYSWTISKFADQNALTLSIGQTFTVNYSVELNTTYTDSDFYVMGNIIVTNPAPIPATINSITDIISPPDSLASVNCGVTFPYMLPAGGTLNCMYIATLPNNSIHENTATATMQNYIYDFQGNKILSGTTDFSRQTFINFNNAIIIEVDKCAAVSDSLQGLLGIACYGIDTLPKTFAFARIIGPYSACGNYAVDNTASFITNDTGASNSSNWSITVHVPCSGCTLTIGYWKNHAGLGSQPDKVTPLLPITLGTPGGAKSIVVTTATQAVNILNMNVLGTPSNGITKLYAQLLAAKLNIANGADGSVVATTIAAADAFLANYNYTNWASLSNAQKQQVLSWVNILDQYNNGFIGPGHCSI